MRYGGEERQARFCLFLSASPVRELLGLTSRLPARKHLQGVGSLWGCTLTHNFQRNRERLKAAKSEAMTYRFVRSFGGLEKEMYPPEIRDQLTSASTSLAWS